MKGTLLCFLRVERRGVSKHTLPSFYSVLCLCPGHSYHLNFFQTAVWESVQEESTLPRSCYTSSGQEKWSVKLGRQVGRQFGCGTWEDGISSNENIALHLFCLPQRIRRIGFTIVLRERKYRQLLTFIILCFSSHQRIRSERDAYIGQ